MLVSECMEKNVQLASPEMSLADAAKKMRDGDFGAMPVGEGDRLIGMITDRDIAIRAIADGFDPKATKVRDVMTKGTRFCFEDQPLEEIARNMAAIQVRRLPVLSRQKRMVGILSLADIALKDSACASEALSGISKKSAKKPSARVSA